MSFKQSIWKRKCEQRSSKSFKFGNYTPYNFSQTHQLAVDKRSADQLREIQQLELKHAKEKFEFEIKGFEDVKTSIKVLVWSS